MKGREVLGVDFCGDRLNVVQVHLDEVSKRPALTRSASRIVPAGAESAAVAAILRKMLDEEGFTATSAVFGLPRGRGFLRTQAAGRPEAEVFSRVDYVTDGWTAADGRQVLGVASRADVARQAEIARQASLQLLAVELRSLGSLIALGLLGVSEAPGKPAGPSGQPAAGAAVLGVVISETDLTVALVDGGAVLAVQTRGRPAGGGLERWDGALTAAEQMLRVVELAHPEAPAGSVRVLVNDRDRQAARSLTNRLGLPVELVSPASAADLGVEGELADPAEYAAAVGLALEGLQDIAVSRPRRDRAVGRLNFLQAAKPPRRKRTLSWRQAAVVAAGAVLIALAVAGGYALKKRSDLNELAAERDRLQQKAQLGWQARQRWLAISPWLAAADGGGRAAQREILDAITGLFPSKDAYVQTVLVQPGEDDDSRAVTLTGRTRHSRPLSEFVSKLNDSAMFERASLGRVADDSAKSEFPKSFSVSVSYRGRR